MLLTLFSFRTITSKVTIGLSTKYKTYLQMKLKVNIIRRIREGNIDIKSSWCKARFCFMKQLALRFSKLDPAFQDNDVDAMLNQNSCKFFCQYFLGMQM